MPITISAKPIIIWFVKKSPQNLSSTNPIIPPGIVAYTRYQNIFPSKESSFLKTFLYTPTKSFTQSLKKNIAIASNVPAWSAKSKSTIASQLKSLGIGGVVNVDYEVGDSITIITEPFYNYPGVIEKLDKEKQRVTVRVNMFGRETTVELDFAQVQKI